MSTYIVPELGTDFPDDFEDMVKDYVETEYSIADPIKTDTEHFNFKVGFFGYFLPYEIAFLQTVTEPPQYNSGGRGFYTGTEIMVGIRMERISRDKVDPQLGNMEREIQRIAMQYRAGDIPGIKSMVYWGGERVLNATDNWAETDWRSIVRLRVYYEKRDIS